MKVMKMRNIALSLSLVLVMVGLSGCLPEEPLIIDSSKTTTTTNQNKSDAPSSLSTSEEDNVSLKEIVENMSANNISVSADNVELLDEDVKADSFYGVISYNGIEVNTPEMYTTRTYETFNGKFTQCVSSDQIVYAVGATYTVNETQSFGLVTSEAYQQLCSLVQAGATDNMSAFSYIDTSLDTANTGFSSEVTCKGTTESINDASIHTYFYAPFTDNKLYLLSIITPADGSHNSEQIFGDMINNFKKKVMLLNV